MWECMTEGWLTSISATCSCESTMGCRSCMVISHSTHAVKVLHNTPLLPAVITEECILPIWCMYSSCTYWQGAECDTSNTSGACSKSRHHLMRDVNICAFLIYNVQCESAKTDQHQDCIQDWTYVFTDTHTDEHNNTPTFRVTRATKLSLLGWHAAMTRHAMTC